MATKKAQEPGTQTSLIPEDKPKQKRPGQDRAINVNQFLQKKYREVELDEVWGPKFGEIEGRSTFMFYGPSGSGKSTLVLKLAKHLAKVYGKGLYNSHEEKHNKSLQTRIAEVFSDGEVEGVYFAPAWDFDTLMKKIKALKYRWVILDSVQYMHFTYDQFKTLRATFKKRNIILIMVSFGKSLGKTTGADDLLHASDVKAFVNNGRLTVISRYLGGEVYKEVLFNPNHAKEAQLL